MNAMEKRCEWGKFTSCRFGVRPPPKDYSLQTGKCQSDGGYEKVVRYRCDSQNQLWVANNLCNGQ